MKILKTLLLEFPPLLTGIILMYSLVGWKLNFILTITLTVIVYGGTVFFCAMLLSHLKERQNETDLIDQLDELNVIKPNEPFTDQVNPHKEESPYSHINETKNFICKEPFYLNGIWIKKNDQLEINFKESEDCLMIYIHLGLDLNITLKKVNSLINLNYIQEVK